MLNFDHALKNILLELLGNALSSQDLRLESLMIISSESLSVSLQGIEKSFEFVSMSENDIFILYQEKDLLDQVQNHLSQKSKYLGDIFVGAELQLHLDVICNEITLHLFLQSGNNIIISEKELEEARIIDLKKVLNLFVMLRNSLLNETVNVYSIAAR